MPPKTPKKTPKETKENTLRRHTCSKTTEDELEYTDDPDKIGDKRKDKKGEPKDNTDKDNKKPEEEIEEINDDNKSEQGEEPIPNEVEVTEPDNREIVLPSGEWYMPDLNSTTMTQVIREGRDYEGDNTGRIIFRFPRLEQYTGYDYYVVCPFSGKIDIFDTREHKCIPFVIQASKQQRPNSIVIAEIKTAMNQLKQEKWEQMALLGEVLPATTDTPFTTAQLAGMMTAFKDLCKLQGELNLETH